MGTSYSAALGVIIERDALIEEDNAAIAQRLERRYVASIKARANARPAIRAGKLHLGVRAWTQTGVRLDQRRSGVDVEKGHGQAGTQDRAIAPSPAAADRTPFTAAVGVIRYSVHWPVFASNINKRTRPVAPNTRTAICGPRRAAT